VSDLLTVSDLQLNQDKPPLRARLRPRRENSIIFGYRALVLVLFFGLWQIFAGGPKSLLPTDAISRPSSVFVAFWQLVTDGKIFLALFSTMLSVLYSMLLSVPIGTGLAILTASRFGRWAFQPLVTVGYAIPKIGLISFFIIFLGIKTQTHVALVVSAATFPYFFAVRQALEEIDRDRLLTFKLMGAKRLKILRSFTLRSAIPHLFAATRIALPLAFGVEIFAELRVPTATTFTSSSAGLGVLLSTFSSNLDSAGAMAVLFFACLIGYLIDVVIGGGLRKYTRSIGVGVEL
jgi:sulfonate transport system permease protein